MATDERTRIAKTIGDALVVLADVAADLRDLKLAIERRSLSDPVEERGPDRSEPLRPENPDEEAPDGRDCSGLEGRPDDDPLVFVLGSRRPLEVGDRLRVFSNYRGELECWRVISRHRVDMSGRGDLGPLELGLIEEETGGA